MYEYLKHDESNDDKAAPPPVADVVGWHLPLSTRANQALGLGWCWFKVGSNCLPFLEQVVFFTVESCHSVSIYVSSFPALLGTTMVDVDSFRYNQT